MYRGGRHFVWCSEFFDPKKHGDYGSAYGIPPSSSPASLYRRYKEDLEGGDTHSASIVNQKAGIKARAIEWHGRGEISEQDLQDITYMADKGRKNDWRPVIYVISSERVKDRLESVPVKDRAGIGMEYVIKDLNDDEFDLIEV